jgi:predicted DNA-binding transcriptional regulator AlpA
MSSASMTFAAWERRSPSSLAGETVAQFCAEWDISRSTFYDWRAKGRAPECVKLPNGDLRIEHDKYEAWLQTCRENV